MKWIALVLLAALLLAPTCLAHASPDPLETEVQLLADDTDDSYAQYDGYDIQDVYVREAYFPALGDGLVFRIYLYGGFGSPSIASRLPLELDVAAGGTTHTYAFSTSDGSTWSGDAAVIEQDFEPAEGGTGLQGYLQAFIPLGDLGVVLGDTVGPFAVRTYADDDLRDLAPGGRPVPGTGGAVVVPASSDAPTETVTLSGPTGYTRSTATVEGDTVTVTVQNLITTIGQHIQVDVAASNRWTVSEAEPAAISVEPGQHPTFTFTATAEPGADDAIVMIESDLGGLETLTLSADRVPAPTAEPTDDGSTPVTDENNDTPLPLFPVVAVLAAAAFLRRR